MKTKRRTARPIKLISFVLMILLLAAGGFGLREIGAGGLRQPVSVTVPEGAGTIRIAEALKGNGAIRSALLFRWYADRHQLDDGWQPGEYALEPGDGYREIGEKMTAMAYKPDIRVLIREGLQLPEIAKILQDAGVCGKEEFLAACREGSFDYDFLKGTDKAGRRRLEGYLFPDTYRFFPGTEPEYIIDTMLARFGRMAYTPERIARAEELGYSFDEMLTLGSVIESEARTEQDRRDVSAVFHHRLDGNPYAKMQSCVTVEFARGIHKNILSLKDMEIDSPYNTYMYPGLPIGPICCPGLVSLDAALWPAENDFWYFQSDSKGKLWFAETYAEHARISREVQKDWAVTTRIVGE